MMNNVVTNKINKKTSSTVCPHAASYALIAAEAALSAGAPITPTQTSYLIGACSTFDSLTKTNLGETLLSAFHAKIPHNPMLTLAMIRNHLNRGERVHAERLAATLDSVDPGRIFEQAESTVSHILAACC
jgi:hypothetical protein